MFAVIFVVLASQTFQNWAGNINSVSAFQKWYFFFRYKAAQRVSGQIALACCLIDCYKEFARGHFSTLLFFNFEKQKKRLIAPVSSVTEERDEKTNQSATKERGAKTNRFLIGKFCREPLSLFFSRVVLLNSVPCHFLPFFAAIFSFSDFLRILYHIKHLFG